MNERHLLDGGVGEGHHVGEAAEKFRLRGLELKLPGLMFGFRIE